MIRLNCPACAHPCEFADYLGGLTAVCKNCSHRIPVPRRTAAGDAFTAVPDATPPQSPAPPPREAITTPPKPVSPLQAPPPREAIQTRPETSSPAASPGSGITRPTPRSIVNEPNDTSSTPEWALDLVRDSLKVGQSVLEIEKLLIARGLSRTGADAAMNTVLKQRSQEQPKSLGDEDPGGRWHRLFSGIVACVCVGLGFWVGGGWFAAMTSFRVVIPLACIWFPNWLPHWAGFWLDRFDAETQQIGLRYLGWLLLLVLGSYRLLLVLFLES